MEQQLVEEVRMRKPPISMVDFVIDVVKGWILDGKYEHGARLPSETDLVEQLGASRSSVREAMKILSAIGMVRIQRGNGTYITWQDDNTSPPTSTGVVFSRQQLVEFRGMVERQLLEQLIHDAKESEIRGLEQVNNQIRVEMERGGNPQSLLFLDLEFHRKLGEASKNPLFIELYNHTMQLSEPFMADGYLGGQQMGYISYFMHQRMLDALRYRDGAMAAQAVCESMQHFAEPGKCKSGAM